MRIFFAVPRSAWVDLNLRRSLEDMGHELVRFDFPGWPDDADPAWQRTGKPATNQRLLEQFRTAMRQGPLDLFYGYFYSSVVYPETIDLIRAAGVPTVNFSCNNVHQFDLVRDIVARFDACVVPERSALADFRAVGARPLRIQLAANPRIYRPYPEPRTYDVTFVGQRYADRADFLGHLYRHGVDVRAWGAGWQPHKRLDLANAKAALALIEDERLDGVRRFIRQHLGGSRSSPPQAKNPSLATDFANGAASEARPSVVDSSAPSPSVPVDASAYEPLFGNDAPVGQTQRPAFETLASRATGRGAARPEVDTSALSPSAPRRVVSADDAVGHAATRPEVDTSAFGGPRLLQTDLIKMFSQSRVSLGFATAGDSHLAEKRLTHLRLREFEAPMSGALYLTEDQPELAEYFEPGLEMLTYTNEHDLLDKVRYYLAHQEHSERIRYAGLQRARRDHTWQHRFRELFTALGLRERR